MSTAAAESYEDGRPRSTCCMCGGVFVAHECYDHTLIEIPKNVCIWCFTRSNGKLHQRYMRLYQALADVCQQFAPDNAIYLGAKAVIEG